MGRGEGIGKGCRKQETVSEILCKGEQLNSGKGPRGDKEQCHGLFPITLFPTPCSLSLLPHFRSLTQSIDGIV